MQLAANLLVAGTDRVAEIAERVGYESEAAFSRAFKKAVGTPPSEWRKKRNRLDADQRPATCIVRMAEGNRPGLTRVRTLDYGRRPSGSTSMFSFSGAEVGAVPAFHRGNGRSSLLVQRFERPPHLVGAVVKEIADQQIGERAAQLGVLADHPAEAEARVVLADEPPHPIHAFVEDRPPLAELRR